jgi:hypothetical protein
MAHPKRNEISKALGFDPQIDVQNDYVETGSSPFLPGDMLLLCSDGLSDLVNRSEMTSVLLSSSSLQQKGEALIDAANIAGGKDNITVVIVQNNKKPLKIKATKPTVSKKNESEYDAAPSVSTPAPVLKAPEKRSLKKKGNTLVWALSALSLLLAAACIYAFTRSKTAGQQTSLQAVAADYTPNEKERILSDSLGLAFGVYAASDTAGDRRIVIGDSLFVRQDTLHINGNGLVLQSDSAYQGPALVATVSNKSLVLENIIFRNFSTAILLQNRSLRLRNVRFENCAVPVQHNLYLISDSAISGAISDTFHTIRTQLPK